ncbi:hypothetical protein EON80_15920 [bacterium]|nr:MAG: hypothetical protein EON80_15920 [bacterium]
MSKREWAEEALEKLQAGKTVQVQPRGQSMRGRINDGEWVTLEPCRARNMKPGEIVLARIQGRHRSHLVLHTLLGRAGFRYLIGTPAGREDGWVWGKDIFGRVTEISSTPPLPHDSNSAIKAEAEFYRIALEFGLCDPAEAIVWCDSVIMAEAAPDIAIIEASLTGSRIKHALIKELAQVAGTADPEVIKRRLFGAMHTLLLENRDNAPRVAECLYGIADENGDYPPMDEPEMWDFYLDIERSEYDGSISYEGTVDAMIHFLQRHSKDHL